MEFVSCDSQLFCQAHKPFLQLFALPFPSLPLEMPGLQMWKKQSVLKMGHPCSLGQTSRISRQSTSLEETVSHRDTFWFLMGILAQLRTLGRVHRILV